MALKLMVETGDKVIISDNIVMEVMSCGRRPQLAFVAPKDIPIHLIKKDINKMFMNARKGEKQ